MRQKELIDIVGETAAEKLMSAVGGGTIYVPVSDLTKKRVIAEFYLRRGCPTQEIIKLGISRRTINRLVKQNKISANPD